MEELKNINRFKKQHNFYDEKSLNNFFISNKLLKNSYTKDKSRYIKIPQKFNDEILKIKILK